MGDQKTIVNLRGRVERNLGILKTNCVALSFMVEDDDAIISMMETKACLEEDLPTWLSHLSLGTKPFAEVQHKLNGKLNQISLAIACIKGYIKNGDEHEIHHKCTESVESLIAGIKDLLEIFSPVSVEEKAIAAA